MADFYGSWRKMKNAFGIKFWMVDAETKGLTRWHFTSKKCTLCRLIHHTHKG